MTATESSKIEFAIIPNGPGGYDLPTENPPERVRGV
jgi:hypothetical protein